MYALYLRVSSEEQAKYGYSLDAQEDALISYCTSNKITSYKIYRDEGHSARLRPPQEKREVLKLVTTPWLDVYTMLDREHKRTFWQTIVKSVVYDADTHEIKVEWR